MYMASNLCGHTPKVKLSDSAHSATEGAGSRALSGSATPARLCSGGVMQCCVHRMMPAQSTQNSLLPKRLVSDHGCDMGKCCIYVESW